MGRDVLTLLGGRRDLVEGAKWEFLKVGVTNEEGVTLADALKTNTTVTIVKLDNNRLGTQAGVALADACGRSGGSGWLTAAQGCTSRARDRGA